MGRYKFNKKLALRGRINGFTLAMPVADPSTGEIIADAGEVISRDMAEKIDAAGVVEVWLDVDGKTVKVFSNGMVPLQSMVDIDPEELGIKEKVRGIVLKSLMEQYSGDALKEAILENIDVLIPKHIVVDDMFASVNYLNCLAYGSQGVRHDRVSMTDDLLMGIPVMYPSHVKQLLYADILDMVEARLQATQKTLDFLNKMRDGYMRQLFI